MFKFILRMTFFKLLMLLALACFVRSESKELRGDYKSIDRHVHKCRETYLKKVEAANLTAGVNFKGGIQHSSFAEEVRKNHPTGEVILFHNSEMIEEK